MEIIIMKFLTWVKWLMMISLSDMELYQVILSKK
jgi:hypothetical protein